jgi:hypothetical protein
MARSQGRHEHTTIASEGLAIIPFESIVCRKRAADALIHHRQTVIREGLIVHLISLRKSRH